MASMAGAGIQKGADYAVAHIKPKEKPVEISDKARGRLATAKAAAGKSLTSALQLFP